MGGNKSYRAKSVVGYSRSAKQSIESVKNALSNETTQGVALAVIAASNPTAGKIILAGKLLHASYKIYDTMYAEYKKEEDISDALSKGGEKAVETVTKEGKHQLIKAAVGESWSSIKESSDIETDEQTDKMIVAGVAKAIDTNIKLK